MVKAMSEKSTFLKRIFFGARFQRGIATGCKQSYRGKRKCIRELFRGK